MENFGFSMLWYWIAYFIVTSIGVLHTIFNITVLHMKSMKDSPGMGEGYEKTKPWHPLYNIIIFPIFAFLYFNGLTTITLSNVIATSLIWGTITVIFDAVRMGTNKTSLVFII
ncbi:MAG: hypothetical protein ACLVA2_04875 [Clostridia bacterium]